MSGRMICKLSNNRKKEAEDIDAPHCRNQRDRCTMPALSNSHRQYDVPMATGEAKIRRQRLSPTWEASVTRAPPYTSHQEKSCRTRGARMEPRETQCGSLRRDIQSADCYQHTAVGIDKRVVPTWATNAGRRREKGAATASCSTSRKKGGRRGDNA